MRQIAGTNVLGSANVVFSAPYSAGHSTCGAITRPSVFVSASIECRMGALGDSHWSRIPTRILSGLPRRHRQWRGHAQLLDTRTCRLSFCARRCAEFMRTVPCYTVLYKLVEVEQCRPTMMFRLRAMVSKASYSSALGEWENVFRKLAT